MGDEEEYVSMTLSVTRAQKAAIRRIAKQRQVSDSVVVRDALRPLLATADSGADKEPVTA